MNSAQINMAASRVRMWSDQLPADLAPIVSGVFDLAYYRTSATGPGHELRTAVAHELAERVNQLPELEERISG